MKGFIKTISAVLAGFAAGFVTEGHFSGKLVDSQARKIDKYRGYYNILTQWITNMQDGKRLEDYFRKKGYREIAVYGMGEIGERFCRELKGSGVQVKYGIDKAADRAPGGLDMETFSVDGPLKKVDAVVVTAPFAFQEAQEALAERLGCPVLSLEDIVYEL